jgi:uncharacterized protein YlxW (UPF0749 family)
VNTDAATLAEILLGAGLLNICTEVAKRLMGRKGAKVDAAAKVTETALELLQPLRKELGQARKDARDLRVEVEQLRDELGELIAWARMANRELEANGITVPPIPLRRAV